MNPAPEFHLLGSAHLVAILLTATTPFFLAAIFRRTNSTALDRVVRIVLASLLTINFAGYGIHAAASGTATWQQTLPFQLCDWTTFVIIGALLNGGRRRWLEVAYFWGIGGSLQAVLTPNLPFGFPDYRFLSFFVDHCGIVIGVAYLMLSRRFRPHLVSAWRALVWSEVYLAVTLVVDGITDVNYGFLLHKPEAFSILNYLSNWRPLYLIELNLLALIVFAVLYLPFATADLFRIRNAGKQEQNP